jgi:hypothetical protein
MKKENIIDFELYRQTKIEENPTIAKNDISQELEMAISLLIQQLRQRSPGQRN